MLLLACSAAGAPRGMAGGGLTGLLQLLSEAELVSPLPCAAGHWGDLAQPEGLGGRAELCRAAGQLALVSLPVAGALPPPCWAPRGVGRAVQGDRCCPALPAACSEPFSSQILYMKLSSCGEISYGGVAQQASPGAPHAALGAAAQVGMGPRWPGVPVTPGMYLWW